jgi:hypothetical protein
MAESQTLSRKFFHAKHYTTLQYSFFGGQPRWAIVAVSLASGYGEHGSPAQLESCGWQITIHSAIGS